MSNAMQQLDKAINEASNWAVSGWKMTFGPRHVEVNSLKEANALAESFHNRLEAISYWVDVETVGAETAEQGKKAKVALEKGDVKGAVNAVYFARYLEKRINDETPTWGPAFSALEEASS
ncbi:MAG: hypothetical protein HQL72_01275 [Magnetococcales bacterium]|nr:hypothetical protein [Magnetococcales bacterium]